MNLMTEGRSILTLYQQYRQDQLLVNRRYQRKLVWKTDEKAKLIDSILRGYPIPLIILAQANNGAGANRYEIIDGIQRLNAIFDFIENRFAVNGAYFNTDYLPRARQLVDEGVFEAKQDSLLDADGCNAFVEYKLAITVYPSVSESEINDIFSRINSGGRRLSLQQTRQAGVINPFADMVTQLSIELRGDVSSLVLPLSQMPMISIENIRDRRGYSIALDDIDWYRLGILRSDNIRDSSDEEMIADLAASILMFNVGTDKVFSGNRTDFDALYDENSDLYKQIQSYLVTYKPDDLRENMRSVFSVFVSIFQNAQPSQKFRDVVRDKSSNNPAKTEFYAVFMALYRLVIDEKQVPADYTAIVHSLRNLSGKLQTASEYRQGNVDTVYGLIQRNFISRGASSGKLGAQLRLDLTNALARSITETPRYEFKQGILKLNPADRSIDEGMFDKLIRTASAIANIGDDTAGRIIIGVADDSKDAEQVKELDGVEARQIRTRYLVGIERECNLLSWTVERYLEVIINKINQSLLNDELKNDLTTHIDVIPYEGLYVVMIVIPPQRVMSTIGDKVYWRDGTSTKEASATQAVNIAKRF